MGGGSFGRGRSRGPLLWGAASLVVALAWIVLRIAPTSIAGVAPVGVERRPSLPAEAATVDAVLPQEARFDASAEVKAPAARLGRMTGKVTGRVTGLPVSVLARAHPSAGLTLWWGDHTQPKVAYAPLDSDGRFEVADLKPGIWWLKPFEDGGFSFIPREVEVVAGEAIEITLAGSVRRSQAFSVTLKERGVSEPLLGAWDLSVSDVGNARAQGVERTTFRNTGLNIQVEQDVLPGPVRFTASTSGVAHIYHFPCRVATTTVDVPVAPENEEPIEVTMVFDAPGPMVRVSGRIDPSLKHWGCDVTATRADGTAARQALPVGVDGGFAIMVELAAIAGPQIFLSAPMQGLEAGPFALDGNGLDLGEVHFVTSRWLSSGAAAFEFSLSSR